MYSVPMSPTMSLLHLLNLALPPALEIRKQAIQTSGLRDWVATPMLQCSFWA